MQLLQAFRSVVAFLARYIRRESISSSGKVLHAQEQGTFGLTIIDTWKVKLPSIYIALPPEFVNHVGGIVVAWGMFDKAFDDLLTAMLTHTGNNSKYKGWPFFSFDQRRGIFEAELPICFDSAPEILVQIKAIMADTYPLQIKRNVLVHGSIALQIEGGTPFLVASGEYKKRLLIERFSPDQINDLYYDVLHLAGRMAQFAMPDRVTWEPPLPSQEISFLRDVLSKNPTPRSIPSIVSGLHRSSQQ